LSNTKTFTGLDLRQMSDGALLKHVVDVDVFAEIEPNQKERIILTLKKAGNVVGYMGDPSGHIILVLKTSQFISFFR
jgi:P-type Mg2+ transporter